MAWNRADTIAVTTLGVTVLALAAAWLVVPEFRRLIRLDKTEVQKPVDDSAQGTSEPTSSAISPDTSSSQPVPASIPRIVDEKAQGMVQKIGDEYVKKHGKCPTVAFVNERLRAQGETFHVVSMHCDINYPKQTNIRITNNNIIAAPGGALSEKSPNSSIDFSKNTVTGHNTKVESAGKLKASDNLQQGTLNSITAGSNSSVHDNVQLATSPVSPVTLQNSPGSAVSFNQQGGITAGTIVAPQLRIPESEIAKLATALSACSSGPTVASPSVENPSGLTDQDANNLLIAFAKSHSWKYSGVGRTIHGQDIGPDGPIPDPVGIHIRTAKEHLELAGCVRLALKSIGVESVVESRESGSDSLNILVGNLPN